MCMSFEGETFELPAHRCFIQTSFTEEEPTEFHGHTAIFKCGTPFTMQQFLLLYAYMYHGDVEPIFRMLTSIEGPNHEQITTSKAEDWLIITQIINRRSMDQLVFMGQKTLALWSMMSSLGVYDRSMYTTLNLAWWLLGVAINERQLKPDVRQWMDDLCERWQQKEGGDPLDRSI